MSQFSLPAHYTTVTKMTFQLYDFFKSIGSLTITPVSLLQASDKRSIDNKVSIKTKTIAFERINCCLPRNAINDLTIRSNMGGNL